MRAIEEKGKYNTKERVIEKTVIWNSVFGS